MSHQHPTYKLGPEFDRKLSAFANAMLSAGWELFKEEFAQIDSFVNAAEKDNRERDDHLLRRTEKPIYLLEAISYKIMDELNRQAFNRTTHTLIIMPDCLTLHNPDCIKEDDPRGDICRQCTTECQANEIVELAAKYSATAVFSKRKLEEQLEYHVEKKKDTGVIGVACLLMLPHGMRSAMEAGIPVRGVPLWVSGCDHWNDEPFASHFPIQQIESILQEKYGHKH